MHLFVQLVENWRKFCVEILLVRLYASLVFYEQRVRHYYFKALIN